MTFDPPTSASEAPKMRVSTEQAAKIVHSDD